MVIVLTLSECGPVRERMEKATAYNHDRLPASGAEGVVTIVGEAEGST